MFSKFSLYFFPLGGDTPFYAFGYEIEDFYLTRKKLVAATSGVCMFIHISCPYNLHPHQQLCPKTISISYLNHLSKSYLFFSPYFHLSQFLKLIFTVICDDNLMRNGCMKCFWGETYWQVRRSDENTESTVYRKLARK